MWHISFTNVYIHYEKMGWFAISLATGFLSCNNHLQHICNSFASQRISMSECYQISCISCNIECNLSYVKSCTYATFATQLQLWRNNYYVTLMQLVCTYYGNIMLISFFINSSKSNTRHYGGFEWIFNIDFHHPLWLFIYNGLRLWHLT
jgi:hypothetical protein